MTESDFPAEVRELIDCYLSSMDHVELLLRLHAAPDAEHTPTRLAESLRIEPRLVANVLKDLESAHLVERTATGYLYQPGAEERRAVDRLAEMYNTRPVTLVRAIYARPASPVKSFADAFRLRKGE